MVLAGGVGERGDARGQGAPVLAGDDQDPEERLANRGATPVMYRRRSS
jgi:hypothetical protein